MSTPKRKLDKYEMTVENQEYIPNKENPERIELTVSAEVDGEKITVTPPAFEPVQIAEGRWEKHAARYIDKEIEKREGKSKHEIPELEGEKIENSGYDYTGPKRDYPER